MFRKNTSGQHIHFQGVDTTTGAAKSGVSWTVRRCIDGTFAAATGTVTEDGSTGWYKFAMSQADTNGNNVGFNFVGSGAVPQTVNIVTTAADPTSATNFGLTNLDATVSSRASQTSVDTVDGIVDSILVDTAEIGVAGAGLTNINLPDQTMNITGNITGNLSGSVGSVTGAVGSVTGNVGGNVVGSVGSVVGLTASNLDTTVSSRASQTSVDDLPTNAELATALGTSDDATLAAIAALNDLSQADIRAAVGLASANLDTQLGDLPTNAELATALGTSDDAVLAAIAALNNLSAAQVNAEIVDALNVDTYAEPTGVPAATATLASKIGRLHQALRNAVTVTASKKQFFDDAGAALWEKDLSDDGTTYAETKGNAP